MLKENAAGSTQSVERAVAILSCFTDAQPKLRVADIASQLGLTTSTVSRLLVTMEGLGLIERDPQTGLYQLGLHLVALASVVLNQNEVRRQAMAELSAAAAETGLAANLAILREDALFYLATVEGPRAPKLYTLLGKTNPLHCTGIGRVLLAHLDEAQREAILARLTYPRFTPFTPGSPDDLRSMLPAVLERGYVVEREELAFGRACIAAPIRDASGAVVAGTSLSGPLPALDLDRREEALAGRVIQMADHISHQLGYITVPHRTSPLVATGPRS